MSAGDPALRGGGAGRHIGRIISEGSHEMKEFLYLLCLFNGTQLSHVIWCRFQIVGFQLLAIITVHCVFVLISTSLITVTKLCFLCLQCLCLSPANLGHSFPTRLCAQGGCLVLSLPPERRCWRAVRRVASGSTAPSYTSSLTTR